MTFIVFFPRRSYMKAVVSGASCSICISILLVIVWLRHAGAYPNNLFFRQWFFCLVMLVSEQLYAYIRFMVYWDISSCMPGWSWFGGDSDAGLRISMIITSEWSRFSRTSDYLSVLFHEIKQTKWPYPFFPLGLRDCLVCISFEFSYFREPDQLLAWWLI